MNSPDIHRSSNYVHPELPPVATERQIDEVAIAEWRINAGPLATQGIIDCIALAALNTRTGNSLIGHFHPDDFATDPQFIEDAIAAIPELGPAQGVQILIVGGAEGIDGMEHLTRRKVITERVGEMATQHGIPDTAVTVTWLQDIDDQGDSIEQYADVLVDPQSGSILVTVEEEYI